MLEEFHSFRLPFAGVEELLVMHLSEAQAEFPRDELGGFAVVGFQKVKGYLPFGEPEFI